MTRHLITTAVLFAIIVGCSRKKPDAEPEPQPQPTPLPNSKPDGATAKAEAPARLKQIGVAIYNFESTHGYFPAGVAGPKVKTGLSWRVQILPYLEDAESRELAKQFKMEEAWDSEHNKTLIPKMPMAFASPGKAAPEGKTHLRSFAGESAFIRSPLQPQSPNLKPGFALRGRPVVGITDGTRNTLAVAEAADPVEWTKPEELPFAGFVFGPKPPAVPKLGGVFPGGFHALMADGSAHFFPDTLDESTLRAMISVDGGEVLSEKATAILFPPMPPVVPTSVPDSLPDAAARKTAVANHQKILRAVHAHHDFTNYLPAGIVGPNKALGLSWRVQVLPYLGEDALYKQFNLREPWDSETNKPLVEKMPAVFSSPGKPAEKGHTFVRTTMGPGGINRTMPGPKGQPVIPIRPDALPGTPLPGTSLFAGIPDGISNTILFVEAGEGVPWTKPDELLIPGLETGLGAPVLPKEAKVPPLGGAFADGFHAVMGDGRVTFYKTGYPELELMKLFCPNDGWVVEPLGVPDKIVYSIAYPVAATKPNGPTIAGGPTPPK